jgi:hypothetical protein
MDTLGNLIDKSFTINLKIWHHHDKSKVKNLLNQRIRLIKEIDDIFNDITSNKIDIDDISRPQHKTY